MRVVFDVSGAPATSGGMRLYAEELIRAWAENAPQDGLVVFGGRWAEDAFSDLRSVKRVVPTKNDSVLRRAYGQLITAGLLFQRLRADILISVSPIVSPLAPRGRRVCVIHDWRHIKRPEEFSAPQRLYRRLWRWSAERAGAAIAISEKTGRESSEIASRGTYVVVPNGRDHARRWAVPSAGQRPDAPTAVTFGHHANKRPELVIDAVAAARASGVDLRLVVLGARGSYADELAVRARAQRVEGVVTFPGFVSEQEYHRIVSTSSVVVLASSDEGFGLPVAEAEYFGIPAVVSSDSGLQEIHPGAIVSDPSPTALADALASALAGPARPSMMSGGWSETADEVRQIARRLIGV